MAHINKLYMMWVHYLIGVIAMAIPASIMDSMQQKKIDQIGEGLRNLELRVANLENQNRRLEAEIKKDVHGHVKTLVIQIQALENEIKEIKSKIRFPIN
jgi:peptidoglycan hydrolase CwlO-like protein